LAIIHSTVGTGTKCKVCDSTTMLTNNVEMKTMHGYFYFTFLNLSIQIDLLKQI